MAIGLAVKQLNVPRERLHIEVLREEKKGLFGMKGERPAKIRVKILPEDKVL
ncbi:MAG: Jag N-terminal domain-containing protein [Candidatus Omnitrophica bacterium]|nr:Jag N-terminal domain-containing protein [Candidatus Omnitrophota bacterium]